MKSVLLIELKERDTIKKALSKGVSIANIKGFKPKHGIYPKCDLIYTDDKEAIKFFKSININTKPIKDIFASKKKVIKKEEKEVVKDA